jgi:protein-arginine kinase activator protein McsA
VGELYTASHHAVDEAAPTAAELRDQLRRAIEVENFELAADLRDQIRVIE